MVALDGDDLFGHRDGLVRRTESNNFGEARESLFVAMRHTHASTDGDIEAEQLAIFDNRNEAEAMREDVDVVVGRDGHGDLELTRQIGCTVKWFNFVALAIERTLGS